MVVKKVSNLPPSIFSFSSPVHHRTPTLEKWRCRCPSCIYGFGASDM